MNDKGRERKNMCQLYRCVERQAIRYVKQIEKSPADATSRYPQTAIKSHQESEKLTFHDAMKFHARIP